ncbi:high choriolytic enzyme 1-like [Acanthochromis polyacanthus]|uniref:high choriolytic enzyme 1-like n=1 Tax=Acanthochromis polyacanthus TaxID=80966 RepID=UPI0022344250|nr:high choriolytic enzyme 1-like [Acanthochromis polyacanthus]
MYSDGVTADGDQRNESLSVTDLIAKVNENIQSRLLQDDIMTSSARNADLCTSTSCKWIKSSRFVDVPYEISSSYSQSQHDTIIKALETFHEFTCIRFVQRTSHPNYIYFFSGDGCWSYVGRQGGQQKVSLMKNGCLFTGIIQHEILHALSFHHEQSRSDRDQYVRILNENIIEGRERNFRKVPTNNLETSYDFSSVMHYSKYAFSKNGRPTIVAKSDPNKKFGQRSSMSANDIQRVNRLYRCCEYKNKQP